MLHENFIHLHTVSGYSFKFGTASPADLVAAASRNGFTSLALTDRDTLAGAIRFAKSCIAHQITPIIGITIKFLSEHHRVTLLARSGGGYSSLVQLISALKLKLAHNEKPVLQRADLAEYAELTRDLFLLHGPDSLLQESIGGRQPELALRHLQMVGEAFPHQVIECVSHLAPSGSRSTPWAARALGFAREHGIRAILSNDVRMIERSDAPLADILDAVRHLSPLHEKNVKRMNAEALLKSSSEMFHVAKEVAYAAGERSPDRLLIDTREVGEASMLSPRHEIGIGEIHLPEPEMVGARDRDEMVQIFRQRCFAGLNLRYSSQSDDRDYQRIRTRLDDEIDAIRILGFESYFLTVADITQGARELGIRTAARGSGAGSLVCYLLGIGSVDPLAHGLIMERFCSPLRRELPDIDIDVESARRLEIYDLVFARYGAQVATVAMVDKYRARHAIRDVGMALAISPVEIDLIAKSLPHVRAKRISEVIATLPELRAISKASENSTLLKMAFGLAERLDSLPRNLAMHPCAVAISDKRFRAIAPLEINASGYPMIAFDKDDVEDIGLLKLDILGVRMQSALAYTVDEIKRVEGKEIDIDQVPLDDAKTFELIQSTKTLGLFQIESPGQRDCREIRTYDIQ